jgi:hypothetical protein
MGRCLSIPMTVPAAIRHTQGMLTKLGSIALLLLAACSNSNGSSGDGDDEKFEYGRDEMRSAIEGTWEGTAGTEPITLSLVYASPDVKPQCGNRTLSGDVGPLCISSSSVNITGTVQLGPTANGSVPLEGSFSVLSLRFDGHGMFSAKSDKGQLFAELANGVLEGNLQAEGGPPPASPVAFSLRRK